MAVANTKSTAITNADAASDRSFTNSWLEKSPVYCSVGTVEVAAGDDDGSVYRFVRLPSSAKILEIYRYNDAITGGTVYDFGTYETAANGGAAKDADVFATNVDISAGTVVPVSVLYEALNIDKIEKRLWEMNGDTTDPRRDYDICATGDTVGTGAGTISIAVYWTE